MNSGFINVLAWLPGSKTWKPAGGGSTIGSPPTTAGPGAFFGPSLAFDAASGQPCVAFADRFNRGRPVLTCLLLDRRPAGWRQLGAAASPFPAVDVRLATLPNGTKLLAYNEMPNPGLLRAVVKQFNDTARTWWGGGDSSAGRSAEAQSSWHACRSGAPASPEKPAYAAQPASHATSRSSVQSEVEPAYPAWSLSATQATPSAPLCHLFGLQACAG